MTIKAQFEVALDADEAAELLEQLTTTLEQLKALRAAVEDGAAQLRELNELTRHTWNIEDDA
tara:strand:+ start:285 stop:470 length:186 start_codon:yes stop_codon:yes gene_type:complete